MNTERPIMRDATMTLALTLIITAILIGLCVWYRPNIKSSIELTHGNVVVTPTTHATH